MNPPLEVQQHLIDLRQHPDMLRNQILQLYVTGKRGESQACLLEGQGATLTRRLEISS